MNNPRIGIWLIGAKGGVASTAILGLLALKKGLSGSVGLVTELPAFQRLGLPEWDRFVIAGHDIRRVALLDEIRQMAEQSRNAALPAAVEKCRGEVEQVDGQIRPGTVFGAALL